MRTEPKMETFVDRERDNVDADLKKLKREFDDQIITQYVRLRRIMDQSLTPEDSPYEMLVDEDADTVTIRMKSKAQPDESTGEPSEVLVSSQNAHQLEMLYQTAKNKRDQTILEKGEPNETWN